MAANRGVGVRWSLGRIVAFGGFAGAVAVLSGCGMSGKMQEETTKTRQDAIHRGVPADKADLQGVG